MPGKKPSLEAGIAELYGLPFEQFTAARNALAARLRGAGRKADAEAVRLLAKPSLSAWAVNQLFRRDDGRMEALLAAGRQARSAQRDAVAGRGAEAFREALTAARRLLEELRREAAALLAQGGKAPGAGIVERVGIDLEALAFSPAAAEEGKRGYLDADLDPPGFEVLAGLQLAAARAPAKSSPKEPERRKAPKPPKPPGIPPRVLQFKPPQKETAAAAAARRKEEAEAARRARTEAKQQERVARAEAVVERAAEKEKARRAEATAAEQEAATARRQADAAERAATQAGRHAEAAEAELARAREDLAAARES